jgi:hypothetical protein
MRIALRRGPRSSRGGLRRTAPPPPKKPFSVTPPPDGLPVFDAGLLVRRITHAVSAVLSVAREIALRLEPVARLIYTLPVVVAAALVAALSKVGGAAWSGVLKLSETLRPEWAVAAVALVSAAALGLSQFVHYTGIEVDSLSYGGRLQAIAPPPETGFRDTGSAHAYALLPVAAVAALLVPVTLRRNWRFGRLIALCGVAAIAVSLIVDLPKGLDAGRVGISYVGAKAELSDGFYAQIASASMLIFCGAVLSNLARHRQPAPVARRRKRSLRRAEPRATRHRHRHASA